MNNSTILKPLKQSNTEERDIPSYFTMDPAQFGLFEACSVSVTGSYPAVAAPPETLESERQQRRTGGQ